MQKRSLTLIAFILWVLIWALWWNYWHSQEHLDISDSFDFAIRQPGYTFINPLLECETGDNRQKYVPFEKVTMKRIQDEVIRTNTGIEIGLYVRNLQNGPWFGINENIDFSPASLLKVSTLMAYLKWIEIDPSIWNKKFILTGNDLNSWQYFNPEKTLIKWKEYLTKELLEEMIVYSDNQAMETLMENIPLEIYVRVNKELGVEIPTKDTPENFLSVKDVASFFRILYNASYLSRESSEYALELLSKSTFEKWLRQWVPESIKIAHKFWERGYTENGKSVNQLHDCGIVYYETYPYLICVDTRGQNFDTLSHIIWAISKIVFEEIHKAFP